MVAFLVCKVLLISVKYFFRNIFMKVEKMKIGG